MDAANYFTELARDLAEVLDRQLADLAWLRDRRDHGFEILHRQGLRPLRPRLPQRRREHQQPKLRHVR